MTDELQLAIMIGGICVSVAALVARQTVIPIRDKIIERTAHLERLTMASMRAHMMLNAGYAEFIKKFEPDLYHEVIEGVMHAGKEHQ